MKLLSITFVMNNEIIQKEIVKLLSITFVMNNEIIQKEITSETAKYYFCYE